MAEYKNIPVDPETYKIVRALADAHDRGLGAQIRVMARRDYAELARVKLVAPITETGQGGPAPEPVIQS